jgi:hypothetical protein
MESYTSKMASYALAAATKALPVLAAFSTTWGNMNAN